MSKNLLSRKELNALFKNRKEWCSSQQFAELLKKERHRSDRTGSPLCCVIIDLSKISKTTDRVLYVNYYCILKELIVVISQNTRGIDPKCFFKPSKITFLLVDTALTGAKKFVERISKKFSEHFETLDKEEYINIIQSISISSYPLNPTPDFEAIIAKPIILKSLQFEKKTNNEHYPLTSGRSPGVAMSWKSAVISNGTIALNTPYLWNIFYVNQIHRVKKFSKRLIDIIGALLGIILLSPLMITISIAIKLTSKGPIFFRQKRVGYSGKTFTFYKFRTMRVDCDDQIHREYVKKLITGKNDEVNLGTKEKPLYKIIEDPRLTALGKFLRKISLDELPQFFNVLIGNMSLVGPRPPIPYEVTDYQNWHYRRILEAKPGITGLWQVNGRSRTTFDEMVRIDIQYAENWSLLLDLKILLKTIKAIFICNGT